MSSISVATRATVLLLLGTSFATAFYNRSSEDRPPRTPGTETHEHTLAHGHTDVADNRHEPAHAQLNSLFEQAHKQTHEAAVKLKAASYYTPAQRRLTDWDRNKTNTKIKTEPFVTVPRLRFSQVNVKPSKHSRTLVVICTAVSLWHITEMTLQSLSLIHDDFDLVLIDDKSRNVNIEKKAASLGVPVLKWDGDAPRGNTNIWNTAWNYAVGCGYENIIICNNDLLIPEGTVDKLVEGLDAGWAWLLPVTSARGTNYPLHRLQDHYQLPTGENDWTDNPMNYQLVQDMLNPLHMVDKIIRVDRPNGYMMAFRISAIRRYAFDANHLFNPTTVNVGNEEFLGKHIRNEIKRNETKGESGTREQKVMGIIPTAFVFHYKGATLYRNIANRDALGEAAFHINTTDT